MWRVRFDLFSLTFSLLSVLLFSFLSTANENAPDLSKDELLRFAKANCMYWYFKKMKYYTKDIRLVASSIVEVGSQSADKYEKIAISMKNYKPSVSTKNNIDVDLLKCFVFDADEEFMASIGLSQYVRD